MILARRLGKTFGRIAALRRVDLSVEAGEHVAILGANGAGKTTLLRILATLSKPSAGSLEIGGVDAVKSPQMVRARIGVIEHQPLLYDDLTVSENLHFYGRMYGLQGIGRRADEVLRQVGLSSRAGERVRVLSRGQQQRVAIARAILHDPELLLLDEPDTGLDAEGRELLEQLLREERRTILFSTHSRDWAARWATRTVTLESGRIQPDGAAR